MTKKITPELLAELERLAKSATPGPWDVHEEYDVRAPEYGSILEVECYTGDGYPVAEFTTAEDAAFIAAADPDTVIALVEEVSRLRVELEQLKALAPYVDAEAEELMRTVVEQDERIERLEGALRLFNSFVPGWADPDRESPEGMCPTMYGTRSHEGDAAVRERVAKARAVLNRNKEAE